MVSDLPQFSSFENTDVFLHKLLLPNWDQPECMLQLNSGLLLADVANSDFLNNTRMFLAALAENGDVPATATGNLNRKFVRSMFERLKFPQLFRESILQFSKALNETDLWQLHIIRLVSECAGLVSRRKKHFQITKLGRTLLPDDQAGKLYQILFITYFQRFDLQYEFQYRDVPGIQQTMTVILWNLHMLAQDWKPVQGLGPEILLPGVYVQMRSAMMQYDKEDWIISGYILNPLCKFGLIEIKETNKWPDITEKDLIRVTALWRKFIGLV
jgi:hypothetical protein